jgi:hypothetical protein
MSSIVWCFVEMAQNEDGSAAIVMSGCGTSGRLAFMTAVSTLFFILEKS